MPHSDFLAWLSSATLKNDDDIKNEEDLKNEDDL